MNSTVFYWKSANQTFCYFPSWWSEEGGLLIVDILWGEWFCAGRRWLFWCLKFRLRWLVPCHQLQMSASCDMWTFQLVSIEQFSNKKKKQQSYISWPLVKLLSCGNHSWRRNWLKVTVTDQHGIFEVEEWKVKGQTRMSGGDESLWNWSEKLWLLWLKCCSDGCGNVGCYGSVQQDFKGNRAELGAGECGLWRICCGKTWAVCITTSAQYCCMNGWICVWDSLCLVVGCPHFTAC